MKRAMLAEAMVATAIIAAQLLAGCGGLLSKDVPVTQEFTVGGNRPNTGPTLPSGTLTGPLSASAGDLAHLSSVTVQSVTIESTDGQPINFLASGAITLSASGQQDVTLATLPSLVSASATGIANFTLAGRTDLKPYLAAGGALAAAFTYSPKPVEARGLKLTLVLHAAL